jgi:hypothetical protein
MARELGALLRVAQAALIRGAAARFSIPFSGPLVLFGAPA